MKIIIVGGVAGGMSAATRLRRLNEEAEIIVLEKGPYVSFANCGLPYHISGEIEDREQLVVQTPEALKARYNLDIRTNHEVVEVRPEEKIVRIEHNREIFSESYDSLILSPGATPIVPEIPGLAESQNVHTLRSISDLDQMMNELSYQPENAVLVGAGFIGLEVAENLKKRNINVNIVEKASQVLPSLDEEMAIFVKNELLSQGVNIFSSNSVARFQDNGRKVVLENGEQLTSDLTILSMGIQPESTLAQQAGLKTGMHGGIYVNENYQTSDSNIYAIGDAAITKQPITGKDALITLASPANRQGRQVADVISGSARKNKGSIGTSIVRVFDLTAASTGLNERNVKQLNFPSSMIHVVGQDHASYYPGATGITLKLVFHPETGELYGAQAVGQKGVDKRIDVLATAIKAGLTVMDLPELELSYAPPFGSAKDIVNMAGYAAMNIVEGESTSIQWDELEDAFAEGKILLDVRNEAELAKGQFKSSLHIPLNELRNRLSELDKNQEYIVSCHTGLRSYIAERILKQNGYKVENLDGAFALYKTIRPENLIYK